MNDFLLGTNNDRLAQKNLLDKSKPAKIHLNLPSITVSRVEEINDHDYHVYAVPTFEPQFCRECVGSALYGHGSKTHLDMDTPMHGRRVGILLDRKRYKCRGCGITFSQRCDDINTHRAQATITGQPIG